MAETDQCPTCGRVTDDWAERNAGIKGKQRMDTEDRAADYRNWRHQFGGGCYVSDVDQLEWRIVDDEIRIVASIELSRVDGNVPIPDSYQDAVVNRFGNRDGQSKIIREVAARLGVPAWIVLFRWDLSEFWVFNLSEARGWWHLSPAKYRSWIKSL